jgi:putative ABC transport system permease protein
LYQDEKQLGNLVLYFSLLAVFIGCLGLFGLVSFTAEQRSKEIGIRKVLGASISSIVMLLSKEFMILVLISCLIAWPLAWYGLQQWLNNFAYHIKLGPTPLVISGLIALTISWLAVSYQALKAAMANPVMTIRNQ